MSQDRPISDEDVRGIVRAYFSVLGAGGGEGGKEESAFFGPERLLPHPRELISRALLAALRRWPAHRDRERWRAGFIEMERYLGEEDWNLVEEFSRRAEEGPDAILRMDTERMRAANGITREVSLRKLSRMEELGGLSLLRAESSPGGPPAS